MITVGSRWSERSGNLFTVRGVTADGAVDALFDGGWPVLLMLSEAVKWVPVSVTNTEFALAA